MYLPKFSTYIDNIAKHNAANAVIPTIKITKVPVANLLNIERMFCFLTSPSDSNICIESIVSTPISVFFVEYSP